MIWPLRAELDKACGQVVCSKLMRSHFSYIEEDVCYPGATARIERSGDTLYIYSADLKRLLTTHDVTWSRRDSFCEGQYEVLPQPEEFPIAPVRTQFRQLPKPSSDLSFAKFDFDEEKPV